MLKDKLIENLSKQKAGISDLLNELVEALESDDYETAIQSTSVLQANIVVLVVLQDLLDSE